MKRCVTDRQTYTLRYISWLVSKMYNLKWKIQDIKSTPMKGKKFPPKMASENAFKKCGVYL